MFSNSLFHLIISDSEAERRSRQILQQREELIGLRDKEKSWQNFLFVLTRMQDTFGQNIEDWSDQSHKRLFSSLLYYPEDFVQIRLLYAINRFSDIQIVLSDLLYQFSNKIKIGMLNWLEQIDVHLDELNNEEVFDYLIYDQNDFDPHSYQYLYDKFQLLPDEEHLIWLRKLNQTILVEWIEKLRYN